MKRVHSEVEKVIEKYNTRNPFELLDAMGAITRISYAFKPTGLKGFATIMNGISYAVINGNLGEQDRLIVAAHEAAHLILHEIDILQSPAGAIKDFNIFSNTYKGNRGRLEAEANSFSADFLISDDEVMDVITNPDRDFYSSASELYLPPPLFAFKLYSMVQRGYDIRNPALLQSGFLGNRDIWI
jgi:Zn-dependent peptidase ImmA (M78 family)